MTWPIKSKTELEAFLKSNINEPKKSCTDFFGSFAHHYYFLNSLLPMKNRARVPGPTWEPVTGSYTTVMMS